MKANSSLLAIDLGGTKLKLALVQGAQVLDSVVEPTDRESGPGAWVSKIAALAAPWRGTYAAVGVAVTGLVRSGHWSALNSSTLNVGSGFDLQAALQQALGLPVYVVNDAQAAAWGEYVHGAGEGQDMVFLTLSTGIGGGIVQQGRLWQGRDGLAGHFGQMALPASDDFAPANWDRWEDKASGRWLAAQALQAGQGADARAVFDQAANGAAWALAALDACALRCTVLLRNIQFMLDPQRVVLGGGIGLRPEFQQRIRTHLAAFGATARPTIFPAKLGVDAGLIGVADLANKFFNPERKTDETQSVF